MAGELNGVIPTSNCSYVCSPNNVAIPGPSFICNGTPVDYTLNNAPAGATITWTSSNTAIATVPSSGNPVAVTRTGAGQVTLTAYVYSQACGITTPVTFNILDGNPVAPGITIRGIEPGPGTQMDVTAVTNEQPPYLWYVDNTLVYTAYS